MLSENVEAASVAASEAGSLPPVPLTKTRLEAAFTGRLEACLHIFGQAPRQRGSAVKIFAVFAFLCGKSFRRFFGGGQKRR
jgi:hypothetical protein